MLIPIGGPQRAVVEALRYAETLSDDVRAIYVDVHSANTEHLRQDWATWGGRVQLVVLPSPYRSLMEPLLEYIEHAEAEKANDYVTVILPEFVPARWWQHVFHNQTSLLIKGALLFRPNIVVTSARSISRDRTYANCCAALESFFVRCKAEGAPLVCRRCRAGTA